MSSRNGREAEGQGKVEHRLDMAAEAEGAFGLISLGQRVKSPSRVLKSQRWRSLQKNHMRTTTLQRMFPKPAVEVVHEEKASVSFVVKRPSNPDQTATIAV